MNSNWEQMSPESVSEGYVGFKNINNGVQVFFNTIDGTISYYIMTEELTKEDFDFINNKAKEILGW